MIKIVLFNLITISLVFCIGTTWQESTAAEQILYGIFATVNIFIDLLAVWREIERAKE